MMDLSLLRFNDTYGHPATSAEVQGWQVLARERRQRGHFGPLRRRRIQENPTQHRRCDGPDVAGALRTAFIMGLFSQNV